MHIYVRSTVIFIDASVSFSEDSQDDLFKIQLLQSGAHREKSSRTYQDQRDGSCLDVSNLKKELFKECLHKDMKNLSNCPNCGKTNPRKNILQRSSTVADIFEALEEDDLNKLRQIANGIKSFDRYLNLF